MKTLGSMGVLALVTVAALALGCRPSLSHRKEARAAFYQSLPEDQRRAIDAGELRQGMCTNAVFIAWGKPSKILSAGFAAGRETTWLYYGSWTDQRPYWEYVPERHGGWRLDYRVAHASRTYRKAEVFLRDDRVVRWRTYDRPDVLR
jgi:hypothetical protein